MESGSMSSSASSMAGGGKRACRPRSSNALLHQEAAGGGSRRKNACFVPSLHSSSPRNPRSRHYGDRFIPNRSAMDLDMAQSLLTEPRKEKEKEKEKENTVVMASPAKEAYQKLLSKTMMMNRTRILSFKNKPALQIADEGYFTNASFRQSIPAKRRRTIPQSAERVLDAPDIIDDFYLNLLDWGSRNVLSIALENTVYLWNDSDGSISELVTVDEEAGPVTSVSWAADGKIIAVGLDSSDIQLWDSGTCHKLRTLRGVHRSRVGSLSWNKNILTTGGKDGKIVNNDVRVQSHIIQTYEGHNQEVCGLKWSGSGQLASGGNDNLLHIWDLSMASSNPPQNQWLHRFVDHRAAIKALAWCPFQSNILASGGGDADQSIKFWNTITGSCINSVHTGSQVCSLLWNKNERELLSSHGFSENQLTLWKYPSMVKIAQLTGHTSRVLYMTQSPDGCTVASAAGDETLRLWKVFADPEVPKPAAKTNAGPFANFNFIR